MALSYKKDLDKYKEIDEDEILNQLSSEELKQLEPALEEMDPENALLPAGMCQKDQTVKKDTGTYDRERLLSYLEKEALEHEDREDVVPFTGERRDESDGLFGEYDDNNGSGNVEEEDGSMSDGAWRSRYLMDHDPLNQLLVCMVCGDLQYSHSLDCVRAHIEEAHPDTLNLEAPERRRILEAWDEQVSQRERFFSSRLQQQSGDLPDPRQLPVCKEEVPPEQQERSPSLGQEESEPLQIKEEQEELWISQDGEQLQGLDEADIIKSTFNPVSVKCEHDDDKPQSSWFNQTQDPESLQIKDELHQGLEEAGGSGITRHPVKCEDGQENAQPFQPLQTQRERNREAYSLPSTSTKQMKTEPDGEDCRVSEPDSNLDPAGDLEPTRDSQPLSSDCSLIETEDSDDKRSENETDDSDGTETVDSDDESSGTETDDGDEWKESGGPGLMTLKPKKTQKILSSPGFSKKGHLKRRISHTGENKLQTSLLEIPLKRLSAVQLLHCSPTTSRDMNESRPHCCDQCGKSFIKKAPFLKHQRIHTGGKPYNCDQCEKSFRTSGHLKTHQRIHTGEKPYHCDQCEKSCSTSGDLKKHQRMHTGEKPYHCDQCEKSFSNFGHLKKHQRIHTGETPYHCDQCEKSFSESGNLKKHQRMHTGEKPYHCDQCEKSFSNSGDLKKHQRMHTGEKPYHCDQCEKSFSYSGDLKKHQRIHTGEKPYHCDQCEKSFNTSGSLKRHQRIHTGEKPEKPYHCDQCEKSFSYSEGLKIHQHIHTGEKPYNCDQCEKSFSNSEGLKRHQRIHTGEKPYNCDQCEKSFNQSANLKTHQRIHTGEKPYNCDQCEKSFSTSGGLKIHQHIHTGEKPYNCDQCEKSFSTSGHLKKHQRSIHTE